MLHFSHFRCIIVGRRFHTMRSTHAHAGEEGPRRPPSLAAQLEGTMFDKAPTRSAPPAERLPIEEQFRQFDEANPAIYAAIERECLAAAKRGDRRIAVARITENLRHDASKRTSGSEFKFDNTFRAFYARKVVERQPQLRGLIEIRQRREARAS